MAARRHPRPSYGIGIICALDVEKAAVEATLDEEHEGLTKMTNDDNVYTLGRIGRHNVVVACLPAGLRGEASAATVVRDLMRSFPIKVGLMVGIGSGIWSESADIRLGDVVVSQPDNMHSGVVQWDFGKMEKEGVFRRTGTLNKPPRHLLIAVQSLKSKHRLRGNEVTRLIQEAFVKFPLIEEEYRHQGRDKDDLYEASYSHPEGDTCDCCDLSRLVRRLPDRRDDQPKVHYGKIASSDEVVKDGFIRDRIAREEGVLCFEMEAPGLVDWFPCVVIRGVCD
jgi:nucleoside phosphorylase